jgi:hypothetical protein
MNAIPGRLSLKRVALVAIVTLTLLAIASSAMATGIALRWGSCEGASNRNFACDGGSGSELLVGSFSPPPGIDQLSGIQVYLRISSADGNVPAWWQMMNRGSCRQTSLSARFDMSDETQCEDPWQGQAVGGLARYKLDGSNGVDLWLVAAVPISAIHEVSPGRSYAAFKLAVNHQRSTGAGACAGCATPMCIKFEAIRLVQPGRIDASGKRQESYAEITQGTPGMGGAANFVTWQGGTPACGAGAARPSSWGALKRRWK